MKAQKGITDDSCPQFTKRRRFRAIDRLLLVTLMLFLGLCLFGIIEEIAPFSEVDIRVTNVRPGAKFVCLIAVTDSGPVVLRRVSRKVLTFPLPASYARAFGDEYGEGRCTLHHCEWQGVERYGILTHDTGGKWQLWWIPRDDITKRIDRLVIVRVPDREPETPTEDWIRQLGVWPKRDDSEDPHPAQGNQDEAKP